MPQIKLTTINPKRMNHLMMRTRLLEGLKRIGLDIRDDFESTVDTWRNKPTFQPGTANPVVHGDVAVVETYVEEDIYSWISKGTKPHKIVPVNAPKLIFPGTFSPKTIPGVILANPGFSGPPMEYRGEEGVWHPGIEPRQFDKQIKDRELKNAKNIMVLAMAQARRVSGHAYP